MRDNLLFYSIPETTSDEDCDATVQKLLRDELGITEDIGLERVHRMGKLFDGKCRPIVAKFSSFKQREVVRLDGPKLAGKRFGISEQIPKEWKDRRKALLPAFKDAKKQGKRARFVGDKLLVEGHFVIHKGSLFRRIGLTTSNGFHDRKPRQNWSVSGESVPSSTVSCLMHPAKWHH